MEVSEAVDIIDVFPRVSGASGALLNGTGVGADVTVASVLAVGGVLLPSGPTRTWSPALNESELDPVSMIYCVLFTCRLNSRRRMRSDRFG